MVTVVVALCCAGIGYWILYEIIRVAVRDGIRDAKEWEQGKRDRRS